MDNIKRCPFCGGKAEAKGYKFFNVICTSCGACGAKKEMPSLAIEAWNNRRRIQCKGCVNYRAENGWCDLYSVYLDDDDVPVAEETNKWVAFKPDDYCSKAEEE